MARQVWAVPFFISTFQVERIFSVNAFSKFLFVSVKRAYPVKAGDAKSSVYGAKAIGRQDCQVTLLSHGANELSCQQTTGVKIVESRLRVYVASDPGGSVSTARRYWNAHYEFLSGCVTDGSPPGAALVNHRGLQRVQRGRGRMSAYLLAVPIGLAASSSSAAPPENNAQGANNGGGGRANGRIR